MRTSGALSRAWGVDEFWCGALSEIAGCHHRSHSSFWHCEEVI